MKSSLYSTTVVHVLCNDEMDLGSTPPIGSKVCEWCEAPIPKYGKRFCSLSCGQFSELERRAKAKLLLPVPTKHCEKCGASFEATGHRIYSRFCSRSCSTSANNKKSPKRTRKVEYGLCLNCGEQLNSPRKYCSHECHRSFQRREFIENWLAGTENGLTAQGTVKTFVKDWLRELCGNKCELCGWSKINPVTGVVPLTADHIDGHWQNNRPENLRLLCGACDSIQPTYKALNKGNGRITRRK